MTMHRTLADGAIFHASAEIPAEIESAAEAAAAAAALDWSVIVQDGALQLRLARGISLPAALGAASRAWELAASLIGPIEVALAVATGPALDAAAVLTPLGGNAPAEAAALARMPLPALEEGPDVIWDRLGHAARRAQTLIREGRIRAAALTFRGRGRLIGPISGDLLLRFGVSAWR